MVPALVFSTDGGSVLKTPAAASPVCVAEYEALACTRLPAMAAACPYVWGLAEGGASSVARVVQLLRLELMSAMALLGLTRLDAIGREALWKPA